MVFSNMVNISCMLGSSCQFSMIFIKLCSDFLQWCLMADQQHTLNLPCHPRLPEVMIHWNQLIFHSQCHNKSLAAHPCLFSVSVQSLWMSFFSFSFSSKTLDPLHPSHHCSILLVGEWEIPLDSISIGLLKKNFFSLQLWTREVPLDPPNVPLKPLTHMLFCCLVTVPAPLTFAFNQKKCLLSSNAHWPFISLKTHSLPSPSFQLFPSLTTFLWPCQLYAHATLGRTQCPQTVIADMLVHHMLPTYDLATKTLSAMA